MTDPLQTVQGLPTTRSTLFDPPDDLRELQRRKPLVPMSYPDGHVGWLVTGHAAVRAVLSDARFSSRRELQHFPIVHPMMQGRPGPAEPGAFPEMDAPGHTRYRRLLTSEFTARRMAHLTPAVERIVAEYLDALEKKGPGADLAAEFTTPVTSMVICELLGVPYADREQFQSRSATLIDLEASPEDAGAAFGGLSEFVAKLVAEKRALPTDDLLGRLAATGELDEAELTTIGLLLLFAGHGLTGSMLALGTFALLQHPDQLAALRADSSLAASATEELLRYLSVVQLGPTRTALEDIEVAGELVTAGQTVTVSLPAANRDPEQYEDPDTFDITRTNARSHVSLGHGMHQCLGQELARIQMRIAYPALFARFPSLRLAVPVEEVRMRHMMAFYGVHRLPVTWDVP
ncbi:cytochrome P450 [Streptomyces sp. 061-3]|uniref:cytochrome P450 n=1 Tax=Streptomyces sp. 061-3 TaxID=2789268 RepID=UPI00397EEF91